MGYSGFPVISVLNVFAIKNPQGIERVIDDKRKDILNKIELANAIGKDTTDASIRIYGRPDLSLVNHAEEILNKGHPEKELKPYEDKVAVENMKDQLRIEELHNWYVCLNYTISAGVMVTLSKKLISVKKGEYFSGDDLKRLRVHEVKTHALTLL